MESILGLFLIAGDQPAGAQFSPYHRGREHADDMSLGTAHATAPDLGHVLG
jgi:hypothetical protein